MSGPAPRPWHPLALRLKAEGELKHVEIAEQCGVSTTTLTKLFSPAYRARANATTIQYRKRRIKEDPAFRARVLAWAKKDRIRRQARAEAAETGRPVEEIYAAWGVA